MGTAHVITPNGRVLRYSGVGYIVRAERATELYTDKEKTGWIADVPKGWTVGWAQPRAVGVDTAAEDLRRDIRNAPGATLASIKLALRKFDARTQYWKD